MESKNRVAQFSVDAEYRAMVSLAAKLTWISFILKNLGIHLSGMPVLYYDNIGAL